MKSLNTLLISTITVGLLAELESDGYCLQEIAEALIENDAVNEETGKLTTVADPDDFVRVHLLHAYLLSDEAAAVREHIDACLNNCETSDHQDYSSTMNHLQRVALVDAADANHIRTILLGHAIADTEGSGVVDVSVSKGQVSLRVPATLESLEGSFNADDITDRMLSLCDMDLVDSYQASHNSGMVGGNRTETISLNIKMKNGNSVTFSTTLEGRNTQVGNHTTSETVITTTISVDAPVVEVVVKPTKTAIKKAVKDVAAKKKPVAKKRK